MKTIQQVNAPAPEPDGTFVLELPYSATVLDAALLPTGPGVVTLVLFVLGDSAGILLDRRFAVYQPGQAITTLGQLVHVASPLTMTPDGIVSAHVFEVRRPLVAPI